MIAQRLDRNTYVDIDKLQLDSESTSPEQLEQSYERDSRWKPHLSWSFLSWSLQQRMEEQAAQRELAWQRIADKLGPLLLAEGSCNFGTNEFQDGAIQERTSEKVPLINSQQDIYIQQSLHSNINDQSQLNTKLDDELEHSEQYKKAKRRCLTVSGVLISLMLLLFIILLLMGFGILHR